MSPEELHSAHQRMLEEMAQLQEQCRQLKELNRSMRAEEQLYRELLVSKDRQIAEQALAIDEQKALIDHLQRMLFGPKSERMTPEQAAELEAVVGDLAEQEQRPVTDGEELLQEEMAPTDAPATPRAQRKPRQVPTHLEVKTTVLEPTEPVCSQCNHLGEEIGREVTEQVDLIPARLIVRRTVRIKRRCRCGCGGVAIAPLPAQLLPSSKLGVGLAVFILLSKYDDHLALYTLERIFRERHGVVIPRQQMVQWIEHVAGLLRLIVDRMWARMRQDDYLQIDETPVRVMDPEVKGKTARGYLWFFARPGGDVILVFDRGRSHEVPKQALGEFRGVFQSDDFSAYETLQKKLPGLRRAGCAAHSRRKFYEAALQGDRQGIWFITRFRELYRIEDEARGKSPEERKALRDAKAPALWAEMKGRAEELKPLALPQSLIGKAIRYFINEHAALQVYLERGDYEIDNNLVENSIRPSCVGKKRWLFIGHPEAGWRSAVIYSLIQSCRRRRIDPQEYLTDVLTRLPGMKNTEIDGLLPENWTAARLNTS